MAPQSFDDFLKQQQLAKKKGHGLYNMDSILQVQPFVPGGGAQPVNRHYQNASEISSRDGTPGISRVNSGASSAIASANASSTSLASMGSSLSKLNLANVPIQDNLYLIEAATKIDQVKPEVDTIVAQLVENPSRIEEWKICTILKGFSKSKKLALTREASLLIIQKLGIGLTGKAPNEQYLIQFFDVAYDLVADKDKSVQKASKIASDSLIGSFPPVALGTVVLDKVLSYLKSSAKWDSKVAALKTLDEIVDSVPADLLEMKFIVAVPIITDTATDFKPELASKGLKSLKKFVKVLDNLDLQNKYDLLVETLANPQKVPECIKNLSSVTFVAEVTESALSLLVPILDKSSKMSSSSNDQLRQTVMVTENLTRLVNNKREIEPFIPILKPGVEKVVNNASLPEVRELAGKALNVLQEAEEEKSDGKFHGRVSLDQVKEYLEELQTKLTINDYLLTIVQADVNVNDWKDLRNYLQDCLNEQPISSESETHIDSVVSKFKALYVAEPTKYDDDDEVVELVNTDFSLAYGTRMLLNKTNLRLLKGHRYGLCGRNGAGKSTLMRAISKGQLEGFPSPEEVKTCFVEHKLQGSEADMDLVSFISLDPELQGTPKEDVALALSAVGFTDDRLSQNVGSLSGGWKMKLELARAMLIKAEILLLDEPTNHLDVNNVQWLQNYLVENTSITSLIVSHDSGFLDAVCTDIIHYENKKLAYYKGNLSEFVKVKPEGKAYYTLTDSNVQMRFPPPGILTGVKSNTRTVARLSDVTFTYPGAAKPSLQNVSCSLALSSRVAILGPNGAGKSTAIKLLTGELVPEAGKVEKHPNLRIGYIAQHALQHVEQHKEKTANQYLQWRYKFGDDREVLLKESRKFSSEEKELMSKKIDVGDGQGPKAIEAIVGRQKLKKSFQYEIKWVNFLPKYNTWVPKEDLIEYGYIKLVQKFDDHEASREGLGYRELIPSVIRKHFEDVGLDGDIADHTPMGSLSGGQLVKVVIAGAMWNNPHLLVLDEPTNYLDRDSLGGLAVAIREWAGGIVMISHNSEFVGALCPEQWHIENGQLIRKGAVATESARFDDETLREGSPAPAKNDDDSPANIKVRIRKKKMTRNDKKAQAERRRLRHIEWLSSPKGTPKFPDTDDEED